jgi:hypothetical protein
MNAQQPETVLWDVALAALLAHHYHAIGQPLNLHAVTRLADQNNVRLDDMLDTLCKLVKHGGWQFLTSAGEPAEPDADICALLASNQRLNELQLDRLHGRWQPAD